MPRVRIYLFNRSGLAEIDDQPTAGRARCKKEVFSRLVGLSRNFTVMELIQLAAVVIAATVGDGKCRISCCVV